MIKKYLVLSSLLIGALFVSPQSSSAQFGSGICLGPHFAIGYYGGGLSLGGNIEGAITSPGAAGPGRIALAGRVDFSSFTGGTLFLFSGLANYHYSVAEDKVDLFGGLGISFFSFSNGYYGASAPFFAMDLGVRYFTSSSFALRGMLGVFNYPYLTFGVDWVL
jgi:hypothetical protein